MEKKVNFGGDYSLYTSGAVGLGCLKSRRAARPFAELEDDMTLCMAAIATDGDKQVIVGSADRRAEVGWAGGNVVFKVSWAAVPGWGAFIAGELSKAEDFLATCRASLDSAAFEADNIFDKLNEASSVHKKKLVERLVQRRLAISYERFLTEGGHELTPEVRNQLMYDIERLDFGCSLIVFGFIKGRPHIFSIDDEGEVSRCQNFSAIGSGSIIAKSTLYQREQSANDPLVRTLYNLYEASQLARIAPGVGVTGDFAVFEPSSVKASGLKTRLANTKCLQVLAGRFAEYGPKPVGAVTELDPSFFHEVGQSNPET